MREMRDDGQGGDKPTTTDQGETEECGSTHASFGIVQESVDAGVSELGRVLFQQEEIGVKPAKVAKHFVARRGSPDVQGDKGAAEDVS